MQKEISIWYFIGVLLTIYGVTILTYGIYELVEHITPNVELANLHAPIWWGAIMLVLGLFYAIRFRPGKA
jgi:hypothetical protein